MGTLVRTWAGFAALGAGLVHLAVAASLPIGLLLVFALCGAAEVAWGAAALAREQLPLPWAGLAAALLPTGAWALTVVLTAENGGVTLPVLPMLLAAVEGFAIAAGLAVAARRRAAVRGDSPASAERARPAIASAWRYLVGVSAGGLVVAALTATALSRTAVGLHAGMVMP